jgi:hypothetical protein
MPNGYTVFLDNSVSDHQARLALIQEHILDFENIHGERWEEYFNNGWFRETSVAGTRFNQTRDILDKVATYLLAGHFEEGNVMTHRMQNKVADKEIPASCANSQVENLMYGTGSDNEEGASNVSSELIISDTEKEPYDMSADEIEQRKKKARKTKKKWRHTVTYKINRLYSTPEIRTYRIKPVKNSDGKIEKDASGKPIFDAVYVTIGGNKARFEKPNKFKNVPDHTARWCLVSTDNIFYFNDKVYRIDDSVKQYTVTGKACKNGSDWNNFSNNATMERILCYMDDGEMFFYDENINQIDNNMIKEVATD